MQHPSLPVRLDSFSNEEYPNSWRFEQPVAVLEALTADRVVDVLEGAEAATRRGLYAVGFVAYEAANAINRHLPARVPRPGLPLAWF